jgi:phage shock protein A
VCWWPLVFMPGWVSAGLASRRVILESEPVMAQELPRLAARLEKARSDIAALAQSRERIQAQMTVLEQQEAKLGRQAATARQFGREDLAHAALARQQEAQTQRDELAVQLDQLLGEEARLTTAEQQLQARKARIYWFGFRGQDGEDSLDTDGRP